MNFPKAISYQSGLFAFSLCLGAALVFSVQLIVAKMLLPLMGGAPAVWNTCMVFFQGMLLLGYSYAHVVATRLGFRKQIAVHLPLLLICLAFLPLSAPAIEADSAAGPLHPVFQLLRMLLLSVGLPFLGVSATAPLLQKWFSRTAVKSAADPYFLYAASNAGSLAALLAYPLLIEPRLALAQQNWFWAAGFGLLVVLIVVCWITARKGAVIQGSPVQSAISWRRRLWWLALAFVPSSLLLGVTTVISTDIAAIPLMWVIPMSIYLLTFIMAFARRQVIERHVLQRILPFAALALVFAMLSGATEPIVLLFVLHLAFFFIAALACHSGLAADRPPVANLTEFYFWISLGGVLGGCFNALLAPVIFRTVTEYPIAIVLVCVLLGWSEQDSHRQWKRLSTVLVPAGLAILTAALALFPNWTKGSFQLQIAIVFGIPLILAFMLGRNSPRFGLSIAVIMLAGSFCPDVHGRNLAVERSFFGVSRVTIDPTGPFRRIVHGNTIHGRQFMDPARQREPLAYYHRLGPAGQIMAQYAAHRVSTRVAIVGLGAGSMLAYAVPDEEWVVYEIDPSVIRIAENTNYFTFVSNYEAPLKIIVGDARLKLKNAPAAGYGLMVLDAFSSDSIPVHLLTREAFRMYIEKLAPGGVVACNISSRHVELEPVLGSLAADLGFACMSRNDRDENLAENEAGREPSHWLVMARQDSDLTMLHRDRRWYVVHPKPGFRVWTDDYSNLIGAISWK